mgnify:CR=1 FL=1
MKRDKVGILLVLMLFIGVCGLLYPSVSQYWNSKTQTRAVENYQAILDSLKEEDYAAFFQEAEAYNKALFELEDHLVDYGYLAGYDEILNISGNGIMGYINIDKIKVQLPIYHGTSDAVLQVAIGHIEGSSLPVGGESTHCVVSGHRGLPSAKLFTNLDQLREKDLFMLRMQHATNQLDNPMQIAAVKKDIARIKTIIREKETNV